MKWLLLSLSHLIIFGLGVMLGVAAYPTITDTATTIITEQSISAPERRSLEQIMPESDKSTVSTWE
ncbi:hypothetical protein M1D72_01625 [Vibrio sp. AK197]